MLVQILMRLWNEADHIYSMKQSINHKHMHEKLQLYLNPYGSSQQNFSTKVYCCYFRSLGPQLSPFLIENSLYVDAFTV